MIVWIFLIYEVKEKAIVSSVVSMCDCSNTALRLKEHIKKGNKQ